MMEVTKASECQNGFINLMGTNVVSQCIDYLKNAGPYGGIMDRTQDLKEHEQVSIALGYHMINV